MSTDVKVMSTDVKGISTDVNGAEIERKGRKEVNEIIYFLFFG